MRRYTQWLALLMTTAVVLVLAGAAGAETGAMQNAKAPVAKQAPPQAKQRTKVQLIARVKAPKSVSDMSLKELENFQVRALAHYAGMWRTWLLVKPKTRYLEYVKNGQWRILNCRGAIAPRWACWNLEARIWTKAELLKTRDKIEFVRLQKMGMNDWVTATAFADRIFPGTRQWLLSCSGGEGGHGAWVPNQQGSGASGWLQFMYGTFDSNDDEAIAAANARGAKLPDFGGSSAGWHNPLAQAITGAYMRWKGWSRFHWSPSVDAACA